VNEDVKMALQAKKYGPGQGVKKNRWIQEMFMS